MEGKEHIYLGLGYLVYALSKSDGKVQNSEIDELEKKLTELGDKFNYRYEFIRHVFQTSINENLSIASAIHIGVSELKKHSYYLNIEVKKEINEFLKSIAEAEEPITNEEFEILNLIHSELESI